MPNAFEAGIRKAIPAVLVYVRVGDEVLMLRRDAADRPDDYHAGKWNGLGGKQEPDESPLEAARRELREESGLDLPSEAFRPLGVLSFPYFKAHKNEDWIVTVFVVHAERAARARSLKCAEGSLHWVNVSELLTLGLWPGDREFLPWVLRDEPFIGTFWYQGQVLSRFELHSMKREAR